MITGTVRNAVRLQSLTNKWEQKKQSGEVLSKEERNARENWTKEERMLDDYKHQLAEEKENGKKNAIANKISGGQTLTPEEERYLASYDPQALSEYRQTQNERKAYEEKLKHCKTKDDVKQLKTTTLGNQLSSLKQVINDPHIPLNEKYKKALQALGKAKNVQEAEKEFIDSGAYEKLPTQEEVNIEEAQGSQNNSEQISSGVEIDADDAMEEFEGICNLLSSSVTTEMVQMDKLVDAAVHQGQKQMHELSDFEQQVTKQEKKLGNKVDLAL